jgi:predicted PurR-regulated permease PerM
MTTPSVSALQRTFYVLAIFALVAGILYWAQVVLVPIAVAILLTFILSPPAEWLEARGLRRAFSVPVVTALAFALIAALCWVAAAQIRKLASDMPKYEGNITRKLAPVFDVLEGLQKVQEIDKRKDKGKGAPATEAEGGEAGPTPVVVQPRHSSALAWVPRLIGPVLEVGAHTVLVVILTVFMLAQRENLRNRLLRLIGPRHMTSTTKAMDDAAHRLSRYLLLQTGTNAVMGLAVTVGLLVIGVPQAPLWGLLTAVFRFVPYVGIWLAAVLPLSVSVAVSPGWTQPLLVVALFGVLEPTMGNVVEPLLFGHGTGVSALALLVVAVFWAWLWGAVGLILSTPLTVCLVVLGKHVPGLRFFDVLLGDAPALDTPARYYQRLLARDPDEATVLLEEFLQTHPADAAYDEVILPALVRVKAERQDGRLTPDDERFIFRTTRRLIADLVAPQEAGQAPPAPADGEGGRGPRVLGCPLRGTGNGLALGMLRRLLASAGCELEVVSPHRLLEKVRAEQGRPLVVCLAALPPGGLVQAASLTRRVRALNPSVQVVLGRWGGREDAGESNPSLRSAGVGEVLTSLRETRDRLVSLARPESPEALPARA